MGDHSRPRHMFQENLRVPLIWRHPARMPAGAVIEPATCNYDFFPSMLAYLDLEADLPDSLPRPGASFAPALLGRAPHLPETIFHEYETVRAVQTPDWKLVRRHPEGPHELYDLRSDPGERVNLIHNAGCREISAELASRLEGFFDHYAAPTYDLWHGGTSKAGRLA
jgi:arylsulfatase A-like enzyme